MTVYFISTVEAVAGVDHETVLYVCPITPIFAVRLVAEIERVRVAQQEAAARGFDLYSCEIFDRTGTWYKLGDDCACANVAHALPSLATYEIRSAPPRHPGPRARVDVATMIVTRDAIQWIAEEGDLPLRTDWLSIDALERIAYGIYLPDQVLDCDVDDPAPDALPPAAHSAGGADDDWLPECGGCGKPEVVCDCSPKGAADAA